MTLWNETLRWNETQTFVTWMCVTRGPGLLQHTLCRPAFEDRLELAVCVECNSFYSHGSSFKALFLALQVVQFQEWKCSFWLQSPWWLRVWEVTQVRATGFLIWDDQPWRLSGRADYVPSPNEARVVAMLGRDSFVIRYIPQSQKCISLVAEEVQVQLLVHNVHRTDVASEMKQFLILTYPYIMQGVPRNEWEWPYNPE